MNSTSKMVAVLAGLLSISVPVASFSPATIPGSAQSIIDSANRLISRVNHELLAPRGYAISSPSATRVTADATARFAASSARMHAGAHMDGEPQPCYTYDAPP